MTQPIRQRTTKVVALIVTAAVIGVLFGGWERSTDGASLVPMQPRPTSHLTAQADSMKPDTTRANIPPAKVYGPNKRYCPDPGSPEALKVPKTSEPLEINNVTEEDFLVMSDRPVVHIISSAAPPGLIRLCGGPGMLVMSGVHWGMHVHFGNYQARIVVVNPVRADTEHFDPAKVSVAGAIPAEVIYCSTRGASDLRPCSSLKLK